MNSPEIRLHGRVTASTPVAVTITPGPDSMHTKPGGTITAIVVQGTGLDNWKAVVGEPIAVKFTTA